MGMTLAQWVTQTAYEQLLTGLSSNRNRFSGDLLHISADVSVPYATCHFCLSESLVFRLIRHVFLSDG